MENRNFNICFLTKGENWPPDAECKTPQPTKKNRNNIIITSQFIIFKLFNKLLFFDI